MERDKKIIKNGFIQTPFNYTGNKYKLLDQLLPEFDYSKNTFVDVFCGGGSVFTNVIDKYKTIYANDLIVDLIQSMSSLILTKDDFVDKVKEFVVEKEDQFGYNKLRNDYNTIDDILKPIRFYSLLLCCTNNMIRFNNDFKFNQTFGKRSFNQSTELKINEWSSHINKYLHDTDLLMLSLPFLELIKMFSKEKFNEFMFYFDPPYGYIKDSNGKIGNKQISEAGYNAFWKKEDELNLYNSIIELSKNGASFAISGVIEHDGKKSWILDKLKNDGFNVIYFNYDYKKVARNKVDKGTKEILIKNY